VDHQATHHGLPNFPLDKSSSGLYMILSNESSIARVAPFSDLLSLSQNAFRFPRAPRSRPTILLIIDFGAGSLDAAFANITKDRTVGGIQSFGNSKLGRRDFDFRLVEYCLIQRPILKTFRSGEDRSRILHGLLTRCREAKEKLSHEDEVEIDCNFNRPQISVDAVVVTREIFDHLCRRELEQFKDCIDSLRYFAHAKHIVIGDALLVG
jgi:molecular chaperone DnaK (HSP70)